MSIRPRGSAPTDDRRTVLCRTAVGKRRWGSFHNSALRRFTGQQMRNRRVCNVLRPSGTVAPLPNGPLWPWLERPASPRARCGVGPSVFSHSRRPPRRVAPAPEIPPGRGSSAASRRRRKRSPSTRLSERRASPWPRRFADERLWPEATGRPLRPCFTLTPTFRFRTRTTGPSSRSRCIVPGDRTIAMRKLFLLGPALLPAQASSTMAGACPSERDGRADGVGCALRPGPTLGTPPPLAFPQG